MRLEDVSGTVGLRAIPIHGGRASGSTHLLGETELDRPNPPRGSILVAPGAWWPPPSATGLPVNAIVVEVAPLPSSPVVPVPAVAGLGPDLFREGEPVEVDGDHGEVVLPGVVEKEVVTSFLQRDDGRVLLLRRSDRVGSFRGHWAGISGYLEDPTPLEQALREVREEAGIESNDLTVLRAGAPVPAREGRTIYIAHPFLMRTRRTDVRIDWEHSAFEWVDPIEIVRRETVPNLDRAWASVAGPLPVPGKR